MSEHDPQTGAQYTPLEHLDERRSLANTPLRKFFEAAVRYEASDLLLRGGQVPKLRIRGELKSVEADALAPDEFEKWIESSLSPTQWQSYSTHGSIDVGIDFEMNQAGTRRFRINIYRTRGRSALAARRVNSEILDFEHLHLPPTVSEIADGRQGLVLVCGIRLQTVQQVAHLQLLRPYAAHGRYRSVEYLVQPLVRP